jgi:hypothetical protein
MLSFSEKDPFSADGMDEALCNNCGFSKIERYGIFAIMFIGGWLMSWLAFINLMTPSLFATFYTIGNIISLSSSFFLSGPCNQLKNMFKPVRIIATCVYLIMMAITLFVVIKRFNIGIVLLCAFIQFLAMCWYMITYIPYGQTMLKNCMCSICRG